MRKLEPGIARLDTPTDLSPEAVRQISAALNALLADTFALYLKTKNFHWHVSGPHFRDYHLLLDEQAGQLENSIERAARPSGPVTKGRSRNTLVSRRLPVCKNRRSRPRTGGSKHCMVRNRYLALAISS
ncbi:MAG: hypothetical protein E6G86_01565 [Alphaproteobacteria bacterium]|nr:MAG: hypothetical protein E6G86_01565 [Alphaproteobacteria bacterium]